MRCPICHGELEPDYMLLITYVDFIDVRIDCHGCGTQCLHRIKTLTVVGNFHSHQEEVKE